jgi:nucleotide-binding universal stress UspA family protein
VFKHILVPIDGSPCSLNALDIAANFARDQHAQLTICTVVDPAGAVAISFEATMAAACLDALDEKAKALLYEATLRARSDSADTALLQGPTVDSILEHCKACSADLIVVGSHGRGGLSRLLIGSVAEGIIRNAEVPVMVVRQVPVTHATRTPSQAQQAASQPS